MQVFDYIKINNTGFAVIKDVEILVGDVLTLIFLYHWKMDDLANFSADLTPEMVSAALGYAYENPDTVEGQFYFLTDPCPLMRVLGIL